MKNNKLNYIYLFLILVFVSMCTCNIERDNVLDPKNPDSKQLQKVLIQAFVNTEHETLYNDYMLQALYQLKNEYNGQIIIAEHHRHTPDAESPYHTVDNELLYQIYLNGFEEPIKGVPDVFLNGIQARVQGASSVSTALFRLQEALSAEVKHDSRFLINVNVEMSGSAVQPEITVARLGKKDATSILVKCLLMSYVDNYHQFVVVDQSQSRLITRIEHGESEKVEMPELISASNPASALIVYITDRQEQVVYQSESIDL